MYKILPSIPLSRLTPYAEEIIGNHQCGLRPSRSSTYHIFWIRQVLEGKNGIKRNSASALYRLQKAYDSIKREVLCNILIEFGIQLKMVRLIKVCKHIAESG